MLPPGPPPARLRRPLRLVLGAVLAAALLIALPGAAAGRKKPSVPLGPNSLGPCPGDPIDPDRVIEGQFPLALLGSYVMVPLEVPPGTTQLRVKYCFEPDNTVDLGLWQTRPKKGKPWGPDQFRGWGGSSHPDVAVTAQGFSTEAEYLTNPKGYVPGRTTRGFVPGPIPPGTWAIELGVGGVLSVDEGDEDGLADWRVEVEFSSDPAFAAEPYVPAAYDETPANATPGWYAGDMHVHAEHSALGDATMSETFDFAFAPLDAGGAGLDFIALSDYVTPTGWGEIGRYQPLYPGKLIIRSSEVITYRGHTNNHASLRYVDHRTGPVYELREDGKLKRLRKDRDPRQIFKEVHQAGGWTQLNHVTTCPSTDANGNPDLYCRRTCRGCPWDYTKRETKPASVDAIEIASGKPALFGPTNLFTLGALVFYEDELARGFHIAAVGSSDSHHAGAPQTPLQSAIGKATTVVYAAELSEKGIRDGVLAGHTYVKIFGNEVPDLRLEASVPGSPEPPAIFGDTVKAKAVDFEARVLNVEDADGELELVVLKDGQPVESVPVAVPETVHGFASSGPGRYGLELRRGDEILCYSTPIWVARKH
jgi:hypothetical protein